MIKLLLLFFFLYFTVNKRQKLWSLFFSFPFYYYYFLSYIVSFEFLFFFQKRIEVNILFFRVHLSKGLTADQAQMSDERILLISGLPSKICQEKEKLYHLLGTYGAIQQLRIGCASLTKGFCIVVYELVDSAKKAVEALNDYQIVKDKKVKVAVYDEGYKRKLEKRKRKREIQAEYNKHVTETGDSEIRKEK